MTKSHAPKDIFLTPACPGKIEIPTEEERAALGAMKAIKERVRDVKKRLRALKVSGRNESEEERIELEKELAQMKIDWNRWEEKRRKAAKERMILLGHEKE